MITGHSISDRMDQLNSCLGVEIYRSHSAANDQLPIVQAFLAPLVPGGHCVTIDVWYNGAALDFSLVNCFDGFFVQVTVRCCRTLLDNIIAAAPITVPQLHVDPLVLPDSEFLQVTAHVPGGDTLISSRSAFSVVGHGPSLGLASLALLTGDRFSDSSDAIPDDPPAKRAEKTKEQLSPSQKRALRSPAVTALIQIQTLAVKMVPRMCRISTSLKKHMKSFGKLTAGVDTMALDRHLAGDKSDDFAGGRACYAPDACECA